MRHAAIIFMAGTSGVDSGRCPFRPDVSLNANPGLASPTIHNVCLNDKRLPVRAHMALAFVWFRVVTAVGLACRAGMQGFAWAYSSRFAMEFASSSRPTGR